MTDLTPAQQREIAKYPAQYQRPKYRLSEARGRQIKRTLSEVPDRGSYLDVSCGRGELLQFAQGLGFERIAGTEVVPALIGGPVVYAVAWDLPFEAKSFEVVSMFDVIEHLLPGDDERACRELERVASNVILLTANNRSSNKSGVELHVNRRPYDQWDALFRQWFRGQVTWLKDRVANKSEMWRIDLRCRR